MPETEAEAFCQALQQAEGLPSWIIGRVEAGDRIANLANDIQIIPVPAEDTPGRLW